MESREFNKENFLFSSESSVPNANKIFLGGISWNTTEEVLREYFSKYGEVEDVIIMLEKISRKPRGFSFVTFKEESSAKKACADVHIIDGRQVDAKPSVPRRDSALRTRRFFVGGLSPDITDASFREYFERFGVVSDATIMVDHNNGRSRGFGFVTLDDDESAAFLMRSGYAHEIDGKRVEVKSATPRGSAVPGGGGVPMIPMPHVHPGGAYGGYPGGSYGGGRGGSYPAMGYGHEYSGGYVNHHHYSAPYGGYPNGPYNPNGPYGSHAQYGGYNGHVMGGGYGGYGSQQTPPPPPSYQGYHNAPGYHGSAGRGGGRGYMGGGAHGGYASAPSNAPPSANPAVPYYGSAGPHAPTPEHRNVYNNGGGKGAPYSDNNGGSYGDHGPYGNSNNGGSYGSNNNNSGSAYNGGSHYVGGGREGNVYSGGYGGGYGGRGGPSAPRPGRG